MSKFMSNTFYYSGDWLLYYREMGHATTLYAGAKSTDIECPECGCPESVQLPIYDRNYPLRNYCPECGLLWMFFIAKCPECGMFLWKTDCPDGYVTCAGTQKCGSIWEEDMIKEMYEKGENEYV